MTTQTATRFSLRVSDGRSIEILAAGQEDALPLVFHTGTPSGLVDYATLRDAAARVGLRAILYSRPGYGNSSPQPGRRVADAAGDVAAILDHLGADRFVTAGWSGGGPHALACAALLADRCAAVATLAGVAPHSADDLDWLAGMAEENLTEFGAAAEGAAALGELLTQAASEFGEVTADQVAESFGDLITAADVASLKRDGKFAEYLAQTSTTAISTGIAGWRDDDLAFVGDWGFTIGQVQVPAAVWQGGQDAMVPFAHGEWLAARLPVATAHLLRDEGHLSLVANHLDAIFEELAKLATA